MNKINAPQDVRLEREKSNRAIAREGWGPTLRLKFLRSPVGAAFLVLAGGGGLLTVGQTIHAIIR